MTDAGELSRVVSGPSGELGVGRYLPGRGAWLCAGSQDCLDQALRSGAMARALRVSLDEVQKERLRAHLFDGVWPPAPVGPRTVWEDGPKPALKQSEEQRQQS